MAKYSGIISIVNIMNRFVDTHHIILVIFSYLDLLVYSYAYECTLKFIPIIGACVEMFFLLILISPKKSCKHIFITSHIAGHRLKLRAMDKTK